MDRHNDDDDNDDDDNDADTTGGWIIVRSEFLIPSRTKRCILALMSFEYFRERIKNLVVTHDNKLHVTSKSPDELRVHNKVPHLKVGG